MTGTYDIERMRSERFRFLHRCWELSGGDELKHLSMFDVGRELGFDESLTMRVAQYLEGEGLVKSRTMGGGIAITHLGVAHMERALSQPDAPTEYFPAVINIISAEQISHSQIQQASPAATQALLHEDKHDEVEQLLQSLRDSIDDLGLADQDKTDLQAEIQTIEAQTAKSKPSRTIITESLTSIKGILEKVAAVVLAQALLQRIANVLSG